MNVKRLNSISNVVLAIGALASTLTGLYVYQVRTDKPGDARVSQQQLTFVDQMRQSALKAYEQNRENDTYTYETSQMPAPVAGN